VTLSSPPKNGARFRFRNGERAKSRITGITGSSRRKEQNASDPVVSSNKMGRALMHHLMRKEQNASYSECVALTVKNYYSKRMRWIF
jgi:hypothetical protein